MLTWEQYAVAWAGLHGGFDPRRASPLVRAWIRLAYAGGRLLCRAGASPTSVTAVGLLLCLAVPVTARYGAPGAFVAAVLILAAGVADALDGAVAVVGNRATRLGHVYDSVADRLGEAAWLAGLWLAGAPGGVVVAAGVLSWVHEYVRARATVAGMTEVGVVTVGERPTRVCVAVVGFLLAGAGGLLRPELVAGTVTFAVVVWILFGVFGLSQLFGAVRRALREPAARPGAPRPKPAGPAPVADASQPGAPRRAAR